MKINIKKADGAIITCHFEKPVTGYELLKQSNIKDKKIIAFIINGELQDLWYEISTDAEITFVTENDPAGWKILNYSCALMLAHTIKTLYPYALVASIATNDNGFILDFDFEKRLTNTELITITNSMQDFVKKNLAIKNICQSPSQVLQTYKNNPFALEYIEKVAYNKKMKSSYLIDDKTYVFATEVAFTSTSALKNFELLTITGAYWLNKESNKQLQRIAGICEYSEQALQTSINEFENRKNRDHRLLGKIFKIFTFDNDCGKGLPIFLPNGMVIKKAIQEYLRTEEFKWEYKEVATPVLGSVALYKKSGHWDHYRENMFAPIQKDDEQLILRPMTCPHHCMIYKNSLRSYKELPLRLSEHALLYRYEASGALTGLERVRSMELTDSHIFVRSNQIKDEFKRCYQLIASVLKTFDIKIDYLSLSLRDQNDKEKYFNDDKMWNQAEQQLEDVLKELGLEYKKMIGEAAFYGPKLDIQIKTALGHEITISTIQFDFLLPKKFALTYKNENNEEVTPVIIHRGLIGTYERFIATLLDQTQGILPLWLAPKQIAILPINNSSNVVEYADKIYKACRAQNLRAQIISDENIKKRIAKTQSQKIPYQIVIGPKEVANNSITYRQYGNKTIVPCTLAQFLTLLATEIQTKAKLISNKKEEKDFKKWK